MNARHLLAISALSAALMSCAKSGEITDTGIYVTRSTCPQVAIPAALGDVTLFDPAGRRDSAAIDVVATITNLRNSCAEDSTWIVSTATFNVVATRRDAGAARQVVLPYFDVAMQGGNQVVAKRVGRVGLDFAAGSQRAQTSGQAVIRVAKNAVVLPPEVYKELTRRRKPGDADAALDPLNDPTVRAAVTRATFEHLIGFQLTTEQLQYNATR